MKSKKFLITIFISAFLVASLAKAQCAQECMEFLEFIKERFGSTCGDYRYSKFADLDRSGNIDMHDIIKISSRCDQGNYCKLLKEYASWDWADYTCIAPNCEGIISFLLGSYLRISSGSPRGIVCGKLGYFPQYDINKDGSIDEYDLNLLYRSLTFDRKVDENYCKKLFNDESSPCLCELCEEGRDCLCSYPKCKRGVWVIYSKDGALDAPIVQGIPPINITFVPKKSNTHIEVTAYCFDPNVTRTMTLFVYPFIVIT
ncbi:MAG: hypothetical protein QXD95_07045 [Nitrososphaeria archaeon]